MFAFKQFLAEANTDKVLFISFFQKEHEIVSILTKKIPAKVVSCKWADIVITDKDIQLKGTSLSEFKFILFGTTYVENSSIVNMNNIKLVDSVHEYVKHHKIPHLKYGNIMGDKMKQAVKFGTADIPQIKTLTVNPKSTTASKLISELKLPIIVKGHSSSKGKSVKKLDTKAEVEEFLKKSTDKAHMVFQSFVENDGDYRIFFILDKLIYVIKRTRKESGKEFRNNVSLGAESEFVEDFPKEALALAKKAHKHLKFDFSGVDLIFDSVNNKWLVIELNIAPQFNSDPKKIELVTDEIARIIKQKL